jgi:anthraniloyl-CoA monooxygenase
MRIEVVGGGPAGLYFGILMRRAFPAAEISIRERNRPGDTFGFGVVFSDETLSFLDEADPESAGAIRARFRHWSEIETLCRGAWTRSTGHGFAAIARTELLAILGRRAAEVGCRLTFGDEVRDVGELLGADLVVAADGVGSAVRERFADRLRPRIEPGACRFSWLGTTLPLRAFTFYFVETGHGLFQVHAYPYAEGLSTFIVETHEETWRAAGFEHASEEETLARCERLFAAQLAGHRLLANRSIWRRFPTVTCERWSAGNLVLLGDAAHTAHFSIGSGTKLAMEDAIALVDAFRAVGTGDVPRALERYERERRLDVAKLQRAARVSRRWFENSRRYLGQEPLPFTFNLMTRSKRITYDNLRARDPELVARIDRWYRAAHGPAAAGGEAPAAAGAEAHEGRPGAPESADAPAPPPIFTPFVARSVRLSNRIVVSPMCQYSAKDGVPNDWHLVHLGARAVGGAALVVAEMTDVSPEGRITHGCTGIWSAEQVAAWRRVVAFVHAWSGARVGLQIAHAGRKGSMAHDWSMRDRPLAPEEGAWPTLAPSAVPYEPGWPPPRAMTRADMDAVRGEFARAAANAAAAGFDWLELHAAHGYLLSSFLSPLANLRRDDFGGSLENRMRYPLEIFAAVRAAWPAAKPVSVRVSATDWFEERGAGTTSDETVVFARELKRLGCDLVDVSTAGNVPHSEPEYGRMYQVPFAEKIRYEAAIPVMAVGAIQDADHANTVLAAERADLVVMARPHLYDPYLTLHAAARYGVEIDWPEPYRLAQPKLPAPAGAPPGAGR